MRTTKDNIAVLYEDNHIIVVSKRPGDIVQGDKTGDMPLVDIVKEYLREKYSKPGNVFCGLTHRIDRPTSGAVIFAKTSKALSRMAELFRTGGVEKTYHAILPLKDIPDAGTLENYLVRDGRTNRSRAYDTPREGAKRAVLHYTVLSRGKNYMLAQVDLETGRHHQIRCQFSSIGLPLRGDLKYGSPRSNQDGSISLHARRIRFEHPVSHILVDVAAPYPENEPLWETLTCQK